MNILDFPRRKQGRERVVMVTCYDYTSACIVNASEIDMILVGDSAAMVMDGHPDTLPITVQDLARHVAAVRRGAPDTFVVADLPFLSHRKGLEPAMNAVGELMRAGAQAVKIEGIRGHDDVVRHIVQSGVPVMGHLGLTPQSVHQLGGFRVQGRDDDAQAQLMQDALACQAAGCFSLVLECVPESVAADITHRLDITTIGIGAGLETDGQVLVMQDLLGLGSGRRPKFVREFLDGRGLFLDAFNRYAREVRDGAFPAPEERYSA